MNIKSSFTRLRQLSCPSIVHRPSVRCRVASTLTGPHPELGDSMTSGDHDSLTFEIVSEEVKYSRYLTVYDRVVRYTHKESGQCQDVHYDIVGHPGATFQAATVLPFHPYGDGSKDGEVTLIREYAQAANAMMYMMPAGSFSPANHRTLEECARAELSEEAHLRGGELIRCLPDDSPGILEGKWARNRFVPYLCIGPEADPSPGSRDAEEVIQIVRLPLKELRALMLSGQMTPVSITGTLLALEKLKELGYQVE